MNYEKLMQMKEALSLSDQQYNCHGVIIKIKCNERVLFCENARHYGFTQIILKSDFHNRHQVLSIENDIFTTNFKEIEKNER